MISAVLSGLVSEGFPREEGVIEFPGRNGLYVGTTFYRVVTYSHFVCRSDHVLSRGGLFSTRSSCSCGKSTGEFS